MVKTPMLSRRAAPTPAGPGGGSPGLSLVVSGTRAWYGQTQVLFGVDVSLGESEIVGLFGHNGAGKSTLLRVIAGLHRHAEYRAVLDGVELTHVAPHRIARRGLVFVREGSKVFEGITVEEHLGLAIRLARISGKEPVSVDEVYDQIPILKQFRRRQGSDLSGGQRQLVALGMAFVANPRCLVLDEPSTGLAGDALDAVFSVLTEFSRRGVSVLVAEQNPTWLAQLVQRAYLLELGRIAAVGEPHRLLGTGTPDAHGDESA